MTTLIKNGRVINPYDKKDGIFDIFIRDNIIVDISCNINEDACKIIDASGCFVVPGLIDVHVHLREPGFEYKETIKTGSMAAARGGFTTICAMPNTKPVVDNEILVEYIKLKADREALVNVLPIGAITKNQDGEELANIGKMADAGICAISEDGKSVLNSGLLKKAMTYAKMFNLPILSHCEDPSLAGDGVMNSGTTSALLGMKGISSDSEEVIVSRDIIIGKGLNAKLHICHISTKGSVEIIKNAKDSYKNLTCEVTPHHFTLTDLAVDSYDSNTKMNPPLRSIEDLKAIKEALKHDIIDIIATDHAPHHIDEKNCEYDLASNGIVGLETSVALVITELVNTKVLTPMQMVEKMSYNPAKMLGIDKGKLEIGGIADITIIDPICEYTIDTNTFLSKSKNSPFNGKKVSGKVKYTIVNGKIVYMEEN